MQVRGEGGRRGREGWYHAGEGGGREGKLEGGREVGRGVTTHRKRVPVEIWLLSCTG